MRVSARPCGMFKGSPCRVRQGLRSRSRNDLKSRQNASEMTLKFPENPRTEWFRSRIRASAQGRNHKHHKDLDLRTQPKSPPASGPYSLPRPALTRGHARIASPPPGRAHQWPSPIARLSAHAPTDSGRARRPFRCGRTCHGQPSIPTLPWCPRVPIRGHDPAARAVSCRHPARFPPRPGPVFFLQREGPARAVCTETTKGGASARSVRRHSRRTKPRVQSNLKLIRSLQPWPPFLPSVRGCVALSRAVAGAVADGVAEQQRKRTCKIKSVAVLRSTVSERSPVRLPSALIA